MPEHVMYFIKRYNEKLNLMRVCCNERGVLFEHSISNNSQYNNSGPLKGHV